MISAAEVSAVLVTRGDVEMDQIIGSIKASGINDVVVWDNSKRDRDLSCYGRYEALSEARHNWIYQQDDDLLVPIEEILQRVDPVADRWTIVANNRPDEEWPLTAMGVVFHRDLADCFDDYTKEYGKDADFHRICDVVFAYQNSYRRIWVGYEDLPWQTAANSMYLQPGHMQTREEARLRTLKLPVGMPA